MRCDLNPELKEFKVQVSLIKIDRICILLLFYKGVYLRQEKDSYKNIVKKN
jgi:hypothetical protein